MVMNVTAGRVSADSTKVRRLSGQAPIKSCARPARSDPGVDGQIHKKTAANGVRVISGHAGAGAESIISVLLPAGVLIVVDVEGPSWDDLLFPARSKEEIPR